MVELNKVLFYKNHSKKEFLWKTFNVFMYEKVGK